MRQKPLSVALLAAVIGITGIRDAGGVLPVRTVAVGASPILAAIDEQTGRAFVVDWAGVAARASVSVLDTRTGTLLRTVAIGVNPRGVAVDRRAGRVFVLNYGAYPAPGHGSISVLDARTGEVLRTDTIGAFPPLQGGVVVDEVSGRAFAISSAAYIHGQPAGVPHGHGSRVQELPAAAARVEHLHIAHEADGREERLGEDDNADHLLVHGQ